MVMKSAGKTDSKIRQVKYQAFAVFFIRAHMMSKEKRVHTGCLTNVITLMSRL